VEELRRARRVALLLGGGAADAGEAATRLAERLDAPVLQTSAGKGVVSEAHPLCLGYAVPFEAGHDLLAQSDVVLAVGTELAETDRYAAGRYHLGGKLIRIDIDPEQLTRNHRPHRGLLADARLALEAILAELGDNAGSEERPAGAERAAAVRTALAEEGAKLTAQVARHRRVLDVIRKLLPEEAILAADSTQLAYSGFYHYPAYRPRSWHFPAGFCALGFALPVAIGAKLAAPERPVVAIAGDGGFQFTMAELSVAVEQRLSLPVIIWSNRGLQEIRDSMVQSAIAPVAVDIRSPDFAAFAESCGGAGGRPKSLEDLEGQLREALTRDGPTVIEIDADAPYLVD
jgi:thiamine pyrophosphate-dependent acetolactate synthase large subunit-like protein